MNSNASNRSALVTETIAVFLAAAAAYYFLFQARYFEDASMLLVEEVTGVRGPRGQFERALVALRSAFPSLEVVAAARALTWFPAALGVALLHAGLRCMGSDRIPALLATGLVAASPSVVFFATTVEVHGIQLLGVGASFLLLAIGCRAHSLSESSIPVTSEDGDLLEVRNELSDRAFVFAALASIALVVAHPVNALALPGVGCAVLSALREQGHWRPHLLRVAVTMLSAGLLLIGGVLLFASELKGVSVADVVATLHFEGRGNYLWRDFVRPHVFLVPVGVVGIAWAVTRRRRNSIAALVWLLVPTLGLALIGVEKLGAHFVVALPALAWGAAQLAALLPRRWGALIGSVVIAASGLLAVDGVRVQSEGLSAAGRAWVGNLDNSAPEGGVFVSNDAEHIRWVTGWSKLRVGDIDQLRQSNPETAEAFLNVFASWIEELERLNVTVFLDPRLEEARDSDPVARMVLQKMNQAFDFERVTSAQFEVLRSRDTP